MLEGKYLAFSGTGNADLAKGVLRNLNELAGIGSQQYINLSHLDYSSFPDGEKDFYPVRDVQSRIAGKHVLIFQSGQSLDFYEELKDLIWFCKNQVGAAEVTAIYFFMYGRRQDHGLSFQYKINRNLRYIEELKNAGLDNLLLCDIHSDETLRNCDKVGLNCHNIDPSKVFASYLQPYVNTSGTDNFLVYSPDFGSVNRSVSLAKILGVKVVISPKLRKPNGEIEIVQKGDFEDHVKDKFPEHSDLLMPFNNGNLKGKLVAIREDELSTGGTANKTGKNLKKMGVDQLFFCGTHPVCAPGWKRQLLDDNPFDRIYLGDTIPRSYQNRTGGIVTTVSMASVIAGDLFQQLSNGHF